MYSGGHPGHFWAILTSNHGTLVDKHLSSKSQKLYSVEYNSVHMYTCREVHYCMQPVTRSSQQCPSKPVVGVNRTRNKVHAADM